MCVVNLWRLLKKESEKRDNKVTERMHETLDLFCKKKISAVANKTSGLQNDCFTKKQRKKTLLRPSHFKDSSSKS